MIYVIMNMIGRILDLYSLLVYYYNNNKLN